MKKLIALEPEVYEQLKQKEIKSTTHTPAEKKILSEIDIKMQEILNSNKSDNEKIKLYNQALQKSRVFLKKSQSKPKQVFMKDDKKFSESALLTKFRKRAKAKKVLQNIKKQKALDYDSEGRLILDGRVIPGSNLDNLLQSALKKRNPTLPGLREFESILWESI